MGALCSCCGRSSSGAPRNDSYDTFRPSSTPPTEADLEARRQAATAAEARQAKFDSTPGGRAARKAVANVAREREADAAANAARGNDNAKDWLS